MKQICLLACSLIILMTSCEKEEKVVMPESADESLVTKKAATATSYGTSLFSKYGCNLNNSYNAGGKTDWKSYWTYQSDLTTALNTLESKTTNFKIYRVGFSKNMANNDADLSEWAESIRTINNHGNKVIICFWNEHNFNNASEDAGIWQKVVNKFSQKGLLGAIEGWELNNEPTNGSDLAGYYTAVWRGVSNWHGKKIILDGGAYAKAVSENLYNGTSSISNRLWAVHCYPKFVGGGNPDPSLTTAQWRDKFINAYNDRYKYIKGNFIVTELGVGNDYISNPTTAKQKRTRGFVAANEIYFGGRTTVFWYSGYNSGAIGLLSPNNGNVRQNSLNALNRIFY